MTVFLAIIGGCVLILAAIIFLLWYVFKDAGPWDLLP